MEVYVYVDGLGDVFLYGSLSDFIRSEKFVEIGVSERTLRGYFAAHGVVRYDVGNVSGRYLVLKDIEKMERKKVRPKYLFGKEY